jgi:hypothetical protein
MARICALYFNPPRGLTRPCLQLGLGEDEDDEFVYQGSYDIELLELQDKIQNEACCHHGVVRRYAEITNVLASEMSHLALMTNLFVFTVSK